jgi:hypothetical protein
LSFSVEALSAFRVFKYDNRLMLNEGKTWITVISRGGLAPQILVGFFSRGPPKKNIAAKMELLT